MRYGYSLEELGQFYNLYRDLMSHWQRVVPGFLYHIQYEDLVNEPRQQVQELLTFCDLPWDEKCLSFHRSKASVLTASTNQVRQPIYHSSVEKWRPYADDLQPLRKVLEQSSLGEDVQDWRQV